MSLSLRTTDACTSERDQGVRALTVNDWQSAGGSPGYASLNRFSLAVFKRKLLREKGKRTGAAPLSCLQLRARRSNGVDKEANKALLDGRQQFSPQLLIQQSMGGLRRPPLGRLRNNPALYEPFSGFQKQDTCNLLTLHIHNMRIVTHRSYCAVMRRKRSQG